MVEIKKVKPELERDVQKKVMKYLKDTLPVGEAFFWKASDRYIAGIPDIMGVCRGVSFGIELKVGRNKTTALQDVIIEKLRAAGSRVAVCHSVEEVKFFLVSALIIPA